MLVAFTFRSKPGMEKEFEAVLEDPEMAKHVAHAMGATRNALFLDGGGRMVRVLEFPEGAAPRPLDEIAREDPEVDAFLRRLAPLIEDGFDPDEAGSLRAFNQRAMLRRVFDVSAPVIVPSRAEM